MTVCTYSFSLTFLCQFGQWTEIRLRLGGGSAMPVLQACGRCILRTTLSQWMERKDAHYLLMDFTFAQEEESSGQLSPVQIHLFDLDTPITRFQNGWMVVELQTSTPFRGTVSPNQMSSYLNHHLALKLGSVSHRGFQLGLSYSGTCAFVTSIRLYYRRCPSIVEQLALFNGTGAGSGSLTGSCVKGAAVMSLPVRECNLDGVWGPLQGRCECEPGHQVMDAFCQGMEVIYNFFV